jgi:hypothetical protein
MGAMGNIKKNISPKARLMMGLTVIAIIGTVTVTYLRLEDSQIPQSAGGADLNMPPTKEQISKDRPTDAIVFGDNTAVGQIYKKDEARRADEAVKTNSSHVDDIRLQIKDVKPVPPPPKPVEVDSGQSKLQALMEERRKAQEKSSSEQNAGRGRQVLAIQENPWKQFLDNEMRDTNDYEISLQAKVSSIRAKDLLVASPKYEEATVEGLKNNGQSTVYGTSSNGTAQFLNIGKNPSATSQEDPVRKKSTKRVKDEDDDDGESSTEAEYPSERIAKSAVAKSKATGFVHVGETYYSVLQIGVNTDEISPIRAVSVDKGILDGAVFVGSPARVGEKATLTFTSMSLKGRSYKINAIALDPETYRSGIADGVDNHVFSRYSKLALAAFVDGYAQSLTNIQTTTNTDGSQSSISSQVPAASDQVAIGLGKVGQKMTPIFEREFDEPPTITVEANRSIVIMFMQELDLNGQSTGPVETDTASKKTR